MNPVNNLDIENLTVDVVIVGGGGGGLAAAVAAAEAGVKDIIVLESRSAPGGNAVFPEGIFAAESHIQKRLVIDARCDVLFKAAMDFAHWKTNARLVRALIDKSGDTIKWLEDKGVDFAGIILHYPNQTPAIFHTVKPPERTGAAVVKALRNSCEKMGVQILCRTRAERLLTDKKGKVIGVMAKSPDKELSINAKSVIIATGGFAGNKALLKQYLPFYDEKEMHPAGIPHRGDGIRMATEIGAATEGMVTLEWGAPMFAGPLSILPFANQPNVMWVNKNGQRFADEAVVFIFSEAANVFYRQPDKNGYVLFDESIRNNVIDEGLDPHEHISMGNKVKSWPESLDKDIQSQVEKGTVKVTDSWSSIAKFIGVSVKALKETIDEYNTCCDSGNDATFAKDRAYLMPLRTPPYYALKCGIGLVTTHGGIKINHRTEVLNLKDNPIPGLYAAGVETGGTDSDTYNVVLSGHSFGFTINSGRIAGENAAEYIIGN